MPLQQHIFEKSPKAGLVVITDQLDDLNHYCFLLKYASKKLKDIEIVLAKTFFITNIDYVDIQRQVKFLLDDTHINWLFVTTTNTKNDHLLSKLLVDLNHEQIENNNNNKPSLVCLGDKCFFLNFELFVDNFSLVVSQIMLNQPWKNIKLVFESKKELDNVLESIKNGNLSL